MASHAYKQPISPPSPKRHFSEITQYVIDSMRLEGVTVNPETISDFEACDRGELTEEECYQKGLQRILARQKKQQEK